MRVIFVTGLLFLGVVAYTQHRPEIHCKHFLYGYPYGAPATNDLIIRDIYALSNNDSTKFADWVSYRLTPDETEGESVKTRNWQPDPWLEEHETLEPRPDDYKGANAALKTDRGHQAPLASFKGAMTVLETNYYSNITPQYANLNQGAWVKLEVMVRGYVSQYGEVFVMTGPLYEKEMPALPMADEPHRIPSGYWKILARESEAGIRVVGYIFEQETPRNVQVSDHLVSIDEIERRCGLDFFWELEDEMESELEGVRNKDF